MKKKFEIVYEIRLSGECRDIWYIRQSVEEILKTFMEAFMSVFTSEEESIKIEIKKKDLTDEA